MVKKEAKLLFSAFRLTAQKSYSALLPTTVF